MRRKKLSYDDRQTIEILIKRAVGVADIARHLGCHRDTIYKELRNGMFPEDYAAHKFWKYSALASQCGVITKPEELEVAKEKEPEVQVSLKV